MFSKYTLSLQSINMVPEELCNINGEVFAAAGNYRSPPPLCSADLKKQSVCKELNDL
jgi:hypothetical protein